MSIIDAAETIIRHLEYRGDRLAWLLGPNHSSFKEAKSLLKPLLLITGYPSVFSMFILDSLSRLNGRSYD